MPLIRSAVENVGRLGPASALTGPAVRGDAGTIESNLAAIASVHPDVVPVYVALARCALDLAERGDGLSAERRRAVDEVLERWT
jgi:predicted short-subunit dehydrogenase-like oxidoreductase (DUF2520 family)